MRPFSARREAGERRGDHADEAAVEDLARRELGDRVDLLGRQRRAVHPAALELEQRAAGAAAEVAQRLGGRGGVAADERHRRRALEQLLEPLGAGLVGGTLGERVLDDAEAWRRRRAAACAARRPAARRCRGSRPRRRRPTRVICPATSSMTAAFWSRFKRFLLSRSYARSRRAPESAGEGCGSALTRRPQPPPRSGPWCATGRP